MICPNCQTEVEVTEQHYGALFTCPSCQAVYFINFDGKPEFGDVEVPADLNFGGPTNETPESPEVAPLTEVAAPAQDYNSTDLNNGSGFEASLEPLVDSVDMVAFDNKLDDQFNNLDNSLNNDFNTPMDNSYESPIGNMNADEQQPAAEEIQQATEPKNTEQPMPDVDFTNPDANPFEVMAATPEPTAKPVAKAKQSNSFSDAAKEISAYGNAEVQLAGLNYDLKIVGLDTQETMKLFKEAVEDSKFGWDVNELMKTVKNGEIEFSRLSPVKAYILAKRIQFLDIEKHWKQNVLS